MDARCFPRRDFQLLIRVPVNTIDSRANGVGGSHKTRPLASMIARIWIVEHAYRIPAPAVLGGSWIEVISMTPSKTDFGQKCSLKRTNDIMT